MQHCSRLLPSLEPDDALPTFASTADDEADEQIALWALYELHYRGFEDADVALEWHPDLLRLRRALERSPSSNAFRPATPMRPSRDPDRRWPTRSSPYVDGHRGPSLANYVQRDAAHEQVLDLLRMRSIYHLKETDPTSWVVPRLPRASQAALVELMYDEYGVRSTRPTCTPSSSPAPWWRSGSTTATARTSTKPRPRCWSRTTR